MKPSAREFGGLLKILRKRKSLTVRELEDLSGVSHSYLTQIENGRRGVPTPDILKKLSKPLGVDYDLLMIEAGYLEDTISYQLPLWVTKQEPPKEQLKALCIFGSNVKNLREEKNISIEEISNHVGFTVEEFERIERGNLELTLETLTKITEYLGQSNYFDLMTNKENLTSEQRQQYLRISNSIIEYSRHLSEKFYAVENSLGIVKEGIESNTKEALYNLYESEVVQIPIYGTIKAGYDLIADQNIIGFKFASKKEVSDGEYFYLQVKGDSMIDERICDGDYVLVKKQSFVNDGKIGVVIVNGDEATLKRVFYHEDGMVILQASNKNIPPRPYKLNDIQIQGQVVSVVFDVG